MNIKTSYESVISNLIDFEQLDHREMQWMTRCLSNLALAAQVETRRREEASEESFGPAEFAGGTVALLSEQALRYARYLDTLCPYRPTVETERDC